jgi:hypothetical protein
MRFTPLSGPAGVHRVLLSVGLLILSCGTARGVAAQSAESSQQRAFLDQHCVGCHNERAKTANLTLDKLEVSQVAQHPAVWEKVVRKLRAGLMPPPGAKRAAPEISTAFIVWLENELDRGAAAKPAVGAPGLHRLNRTEYANAIRDLLALDIDAASMLPADDSTYGFDNMAGSLGVSPALMERYLTAATKISRLAIGDSGIPPAQKIYSVPTDLTQNQHVEGLPFGTRGGMLVRHQVPVDGEYDIKIELLRDVNGVLFGTNAKGEKIEVSINGERIRLFDIDSEVIKAGFVETKPLQIRVPLKAGLQTVGVTFAARNAAPSDDAFQPFLRSTITLTVSKDWTVLPHIGSIAVAGPYQAAGIGDTPSRVRIFTCRPKTTPNEVGCAKEILGNLARRAFRRSASDEDLEVLMDFYSAGRAKGSFDDGIELALRRILTSPQFVFRAEGDGKSGGSRVSDLDLASRLSFFLWSSIPDDELLRVAAQGRLNQPAILEQQVKRMLADSRSKALVANFAGQWLYLRNLPGLSPVLAEFPDFDDNLRQAFRQETEMFFESIIREDRSVLDLLTADYTFVNERLARHYGIPNVYGSQFRRVTLGGDERRGLLGQGSVLMVTSYATRTSPVLRGKWILENILGTPPPDPPANVPPLKESTAASAANIEFPSVRQRMEEHRSNPACASCHRIMDPIGFSLENFDAVGKWRTRDGRTAIDASGQLADGTQLKGPASLRQSLMIYSEQFTRTITEKLLTYALGRGTDYYDMPAVRSIVRDAAGRNYSFSSLIAGIVKSAPFQTRSN